MDTLSPLGSSFPLPPNYPSPGLSAAAHVPAAPAPKEEEEEDELVAGAVAAAAAAAAGGTPPPRSPPLSARPRPPEVAEARAKARSGGGPSYPTLQR